MIVSSSFSSGIWNDITFLISCTRIFSFISNKLAKIFKFAIDKPCACLIYDFLFLFCRNLSADTAPPCGVCRKIYTSFFLDAPTPQYQKNNIFPLEKCKCCTFCGMSDDIGHRSAAACWEWDTGVLRWWWGGSLPLWSVTEVTRGLRRSGLGTSPGRALPSCTHPPRGLPIHTTRWWLDLSFNECLPCPPSPPISVQFVADREPPTEGNQLKEGWVVV